MENSSTLTQVIKQCYNIEMEGSYKVTEPKALKING